MTKVFLSRCTDYDHDRIKTIMVEGLAGIGFDPQGFAGKRVALKPNLLVPTGPEKAVCTHPTFVGAVAEIIRDFGGSPVIIESPMLTPLKPTLKRSGYSDIIAKQGIEIADVAATRVLFYEGGGKYKRFDIAAAFFDADMIVNLPKFKTHGVTYITGAVKNLFGTISGFEKSKWHMRAPTSVTFSEMLLDLNEALLLGFEKPKKILHIMDAILAQERGGPGPSGTPKKIGAVIIGDSPVAVDVVAVSVAGLDRDNVPTITGGFKRDLGVRSFAEIEIIGARVDEIRINGFVPTNHALVTNIGVRWPVNTELFKNLFTEKPVPIKGVCTLCYQCKKVCPAGAIADAKSKKKTPAYDYKKCIRCYCCKEICPEAAVSLKRGSLQWVFG
jgi:uncharacterized protein (DUF362 family)/Pyruvate/2-oxoacid:ferredoxin oxidoreductase delta subunit